MNTHDLAQRASPMKINLKAFINPVLIGFFVLDLIYAVVCIFFPQIWFRVIHGAPYVDPQGLLRRTGAIWAAFALLQLITLLRWRQRPYWIGIITGVRLTEIFADLTYLAFAQDLTTFGRIGLLISIPSNLIVSWFFFKCYLTLGEQGKLFDPIKR